VKDSDCPRLFYLVIIVSDFISSELAFCLSFGIKWLADYVMLFV
jgi:hypothetical protein